MNFDLITGKLHKSEAKINAKAIKLKLISTTKHQTHKSQC